MVGSNPAQLGVSLIVLLVGCHVGCLTMFLLFLCLVDSVGMVEFELII